MTVYLIGQPGQTVVKLGFTAGDVVARLRQLRLGSPVALDVLGHWNASRSVEADLHAHFAKRRHHGEWFDFAGTDPVAAVAAVIGRDSLPLPEVEPRAERPLPRRRVASASPRRRIACYGGERCACSGDWHFEPQYSVELNIIAPPELVWSCGLMPTLDELRALQSRA